MKIPTYWTIRDHDVWKEMTDKRILPRYSFVKPIDPRWVPLHIKDANRYFSEKLEVYVYCSYGIIVVPKNLVEEC